MPRRIGTRIAFAVAAGFLAYKTITSRPSSRRKKLREGRPPAKLRVVIVGAGFGGLSAARELANAADVELTVLDQNNHHLFQPLLYQVATAALSPEDIATPIRDVLAPDGAVVRMERVSGVDTAAREVICGALRVPYDVLVIATGSEPSYFGHDDWSRFAPGLKTLHDALSLRRSVLGAFERAALATDPTERERLLSFVLVGGGPTGVEMAGAIAELAQDMLPRDYPHLQGAVRVVVVEADKRLLGHFAPSLSRYGEDQLRRLGVELRTGVEVTEIAADRLKLGDEELAAGTVIWAAGVKATPVCAWLDVAPSHGGQVKVGPDLQVPGRPGVYVVGDAALATDRKGHPLPGLAAVAKQQGRYVANRIIAGARASAQPFRYVDYGSLATIGRGMAVAELRSLRLSGTSAWVVWAAAHIFFLIGVRNRVFVAAQWLFAYATHRRGGRIIT